MQLDFRVVHSDRVCSLARMNENVNICRRRRRRYKGEKKKKKKKRHTLLPPPSVRVPRLEDASELEVAATAMRKKERKHREYIVKVGNFSECHEKSSLPLFLRLH